MERLTHRDDQGMARIGFGGLVPTAYESKAAIDRLAAYEDKGFMPEEIETMHNELCLKCGKYKDAHLGACDGCRWRKET